MDFEKAKVIQSLMDEVSEYAEGVMSSQTDAGAVILKAITTEEDCQDDVRTVFFTLVAYLGELRRAAEELEEAIQPFAD
ncbi:hypothetical protein DESC_40087 [Desulfosarcina cetonica]|uniref:hypothetical protein n=1 Tax=Desulfosarcina cetonica TaxID=90730 RepID=UPI0006D1ED49|nr:hypothetical protein [Desulfosarcina cetonica]VTR66056.1 hypothetical protein DESC_40087 [Desulfosarcina cetonica]